MKLYVLVAVGVSDAGVVGVYRDEQKARDAVDELRPLHDGYHGFEVRVYDSDQTYPNAFPRGWSSWRPGDLSARKDEPNPPSFAVGVDPWGRV